MINHKHKFIFIHIPRCGGNYINNYFDYDLGKIHRDKQNFEIDHYPLFRYKELFSEEYVKYYKFAFVRNPWDRLVSDFYYRKHGKEAGGMWGPDNRFIDAKHLSFREYILEIDKKFHLVDSLIMKNQWLVSHFMSCYDYIKPVKNLNNICRIENFEHDFKGVCNDLNVPLRVEKKINKTNHKHYTEYYDDETRQIVAEKYAKDIEYFGYEFGE